MAAAPGSHIPPESLAAPRSSGWVVLGIGLGAAVLVALLAAADGPTLLRILSDIDPETLALPLACTVASYAAMARSYQRIAAAAGIELRFAEMARITLVSTAANYLLSTGGLSGLAVRTYYFSQRHRVGWGNALGISLAQTVITNLVLLAFVAWGLLSLLFVDDPAAPSVPAVLALFFLALALSGIVVAMFAAPRLRRRVFAALLGLAERVSRPFVSHGAGIRKRLALFEEELHEGLDFLVARRRRMAAPFLYIVLDWLFMLLTLFWSFYCVEHPVAAHVVVIGFSVGVFLSVVNLIPAGLGLMEGSMATVFAGLGVPLEVAVVAVVIFRVTYYLLPLLATAVLFPDFLRGARRAPYGGLPDRV